MTNYVGTSPCLHSGDDGAKIVGVMNKLVPVGDGGLEVGIDCTNAACQMN